MARGDKRRRARRRSGDSAFALARQYTLAPIVAGADDALDGQLIEPAWDGHRVLVTRVGDDVRADSPDRLSTDDRTSPPACPAYAEASEKIVSR